MHTDLQSGLWREDCTWIHTMYKDRTALYSVLKQVRSIPPPRSFHTTLLTSAVTDELAVMRNTETIVSWEVGSQNRCVNRSLSPPSSSLSLLLQDPSVFIRSGSPTPPFHPYQVPYHLTGWCCHRWVSYHVKHCCPIHSCPSNILSHVSTSLSLSQPAVHSKWTRRDHLLSPSPPLRNSCDAAILLREITTSQRVIQHTSWGGPERRYTHKSLKDASVLVMDSSGTQV